MTPDNEPQSAQPFVLTSGTYFTSGHYLMSGWGGPLGWNGCGETSLAGDVFCGDQAAHFQLAPRLYVLSVGGEYTARELTAPLDGIPPQLEFRQQPSTKGGELRQVWSSKTPNQWSWQLVVELMEDVMIGQLTATPPSRAADEATLVWKAELPWDFFGRNELHPQYSASQCRRMVLIAAAP